MMAPNLLRVGTPEKIFVECQDCTGGEISVEIKVMNHPTKTETLKSTRVRLNSGNHFQALGELTVKVGPFRCAPRLPLALLLDSTVFPLCAQIPTASFSRDPSAKQYVYLQAHFPDRVLEKVVMVSFQAGYIFIQTDKPLYTPDSKGGI